MSNTNKLNKAQIVELVHANMVANGVEITKKAVGELVTKYYENIINAVVSGNRVVFTNFGSFVIRTNAPKKGTNPQTHEVMYHPAKNVVKYSAGKGIETAIGNADIFENAKRPKSKADDSDSENATASAVETEEVVA